MPTYDNYKQAAASTGWPWRKLKLAKSIGADGYIGNRIQWDEFQKWYADEKNKEKLDSAFDRKDDLRTMDDVKLSIALKDDKLKELQIREREGKYILPEEIEEFLLKLRLTFESTIKAFITELPPRLVGLTQPEIEYKLNQEISLLLSTFSQQIKSKMQEHK